MFCFYLENKTKQNLVRNKKQTWKSHVFVCLFLITGVCIDKTKHTDISINYWIWLREIFPKINHIWPKKLNFYFAKSILPMTYLCAVCFFLLIKLEFLNLFFFFFAIIEKMTKEKTFRQNDIRDCAGNSWESFFVCLFVYFQFKSNQIELNSCFSTIIIILKREKNFHRFFFSWSASI